MADRDLRKAQIGLLRFERLIRDAAAAKAKTGRLEKAGLVAGFSMVAASAAAAAEKLGTDAPLQYADAINGALRAESSADQWLTNLAGIVSASHAAVEQMAVEGAFRLLADGGHPKEPPAQVVASLLGLG